MPIGDSFAGKLNLFGAHVQVRDQSNFVGSEGEAGDAELGQLIDGIFGRRIVQSENDDVGLDRVD